MTEEAIKVIEAILKRGKDVKIQRCKGGYIILEESKEIKYRYP